MEREMEEKRSFDFYSLKTNEYYKVLEPFTTHNEA